MATLFKNSNPARLSLIKPEEKHKIILASERFFIYINFIVLIKMFDSSPISGKTSLSVT